MKIGTFDIADQAIEFSACRSTGPGGQHVNTTSSAVYLRFSLELSGLPTKTLERLRSTFPSKITTDDQIIIKSVTHRCQIDNRNETIKRLLFLLQQANIPIKKRIATKPTKGSKLRNAQAKREHASIKKARNPKNW